MRTVVCRVKAKFLDPAFEDSGELTCAQVRRVVNAAREQEVVGLQPCKLDPLLQGVTRHLRDLELDRSLGLVLHDDGPGSQQFAMAYVPNL